MLNWTIQPRYWSPRQGYATGDVLMQMIGEGWRVTSVQPAPHQGKALLYITTLKRGDDVMCLLVLDGPAVREVSIVA